MKQCPRKKDKVKVMNKKKWPCIIIILSILILGGCVDEKPRETEAQKTSETEEVTFPGFLPEGERIELPGIPADEWDEDDAKTTEATEQLESVEQTETTEWNGKPHASQSQETIGGNNLPGINVEDWDEDETRNTEPDEKEAGNKDMENETAEPGNVSESVPDDKDNEDFTNDAGNNNTPGLSGESDWD